MLIIKYWELDFVNCPAAAFLKDGRAKCGMIDFYPTGLVCEVRREQWAGSRRVCLVATAIIAAGMASATAAAVTASRHQSTRFSIAIQIGST